METLSKNDVMYPVYDTGDLHVTISKGNQKMGNIPNFNTLPGNRLLKKRNGTILTNIVGTCGKNCKSCFSVCYAARFIIHHHNACVKMYAANTIIMRTDEAKLRNEIREYCNKNIVKYFRFHTSGEIESLNQLLVYCDICKDNPDVTFYIYTKAFDIVEKALKQIPDNFVINLSEWHGNLDNASESLLEKCNIFAYDDKGSSEKVKAMYHCPAVDAKGHETGITCAQCRRCVRKGNTTAVYSH